MRKDKCWRKDFCDICTIMPHISTVHGIMKCHKNTRQNKGPYIWRLFSLTCLVWGPCEQCHSCEDTPELALSLQSTSWPYPQAVDPCSSKGWHSRHLWRSMVWSYKWVWHEVLLLSADLFFFKTNTHTLTFNIFHNHTQVAASLKGAVHGNHKRVLSKGEDVSLHKGLLYLVSQHQVLLIDLFHGKPLLSFLVSNQINSPTEEMSGRKEDIKHFTRG